MENKRDNDSNILEFIILPIILFIVGLIFLFFDTSKDYQTDILYNYNITRDVDYNVLLVPNNFYDNLTLEKNKQYPSSLIDSLDLKFNYAYNESVTSKLTYTYNVSADVVGEYTTSGEGNKEIWRKSFEILEPVTDVVNNGTSFYLNPNISINYKYYNELVEMYKNENNLAISAFLEVKLNINIINSLENIQNPNMNDTISIKIPLNNTITEVKNNFQKDTSEIIYNNDVEKPQKNSSINLIGGIFIIAALISLILVFVNHRSREKSSKSIYFKNLSRILKDYAELIITVNNKPNVTNLHLMSLNSFEDLIDIAEQRKITIIHYEMIKNEKSVFYAIVDDYAFIFTLTKRTII